MAEVRQLEQSPSQTLAALDLGSNSFHLIIASDQDGRLQVLDKHREMVRLAEGLGSSAELAPETARRALECLERLGQRLRDLPPENVRVVGTSALRKARDSKAFIARAEAALGHRIEIVSGAEEARLIYLGVSYSLEDHHESRLVVDIGGGSTELILGEQFHPEVMESLHMGCVAMSDEYFGDGLIKPSRLKAAVAASRQELEVLEAPFRKHGWDTAIGASGTILAIQAIIANDLGLDEITREGLNHVRRRLIDVGHVGDLAPDLVNADRAPVFPGGVAILQGIFDALAIDTMSVSQGALREGLLHDLMGRAHHADIRERTVMDLARRYHVDMDHAERVAHTALHLLEQVRLDWDLDRTELPQQLRWAAMLHEIGMDISHSQYHKHGSYLLDNMDLAGFSRSEQHRLSQLVRTHRRKFPVQEFSFTTEMMRLSALLRLSVVLHRSRSDRPLPPLVIRAVEDSVILEVPKRWMDRHPLTKLDLKQEADYLTPNIALSVSVR